MVLQILEHSPWLQSKPLYLLAVQQNSSSSAVTYTLRTRVQRKAAEDELSKASFDMSQEHCTFSLHLSMLVHLFFDKMYSSLELGCVSQEQCIFGLQACLLAF